MLQYSILSSNNLALKNRILLKVDICDSVNVVSHIKKLFLRSNEKIVLADNENGNRPSVERVGAPVSPVQAHLSPGELLINSRH